MTDLTLVGAALAAGAAGKALGNSPITGPQPWGKLLGPLAAIMLPLLYKKFGGDGLTDEQVIGAGFTIGATAIGAYSAGKNLLQLVKSLFKKGPRS
jgi:uncharacterized protein (DUF697 family)